MLKLTNKFPTLLRSDNEFRTKELTKFCEENGIIQELTAAHSLYQNGSTERINYEIERSIKEVDGRAPAVILNTGLTHINMLFFLNNILPKNRGLYCPLSVLKEAKF